MHNALLPKKQVQGFLLMEVMVGLLLFVGFCHVFGLYSHFCAARQRGAQQQLKALSLAQSMLDQITHGNSIAFGGSAQEGPFFVSVYKQRVTVNQKTSALRLPGCVACEVVVRWQNEHGRSFKVSLNSSMPEA